MNDKKYTVSLMGVLVPTQQGYIPGTVQYTEVTEFTVDEGGLSFVNNGKRIHTNLGFIINEQ